MILVEFTTKVISVYRFYTLISHRECPFLNLPPRSHQHRIHRPCHIPPSQAPAPHSPTPAPPPPAQPSPPHIPNPAAPIPAPSPPSPTASSTPPPPLLPRPTWRPPPKQKRTDRPLDPELGVNGLVRRRHSAASERSRARTSVLRFRAARRREGCGRGGKWGRSWRLRG